MSKTLKMIVKELPKTMGQLNHELLLEDLKIALKEVVALEQQLQQAHRAGWEQCKREAVDHLRYQHNLVVGEASLDYLATLEQCWNAIASMEYKGAANDWQ